MKLTIPQLRVLQALMPRKGSKALPFLTRTRLAERAGWTALSGTVNRALHGLHGAADQPYPGLLELKLVARKTVDVDGVAETGYMLTAKGLKTVTAALNEAPLPKLRDRDASTNNRYKTDASA